MLIFIISIIIVVALGFLSWIIFKHFPDLKNLDVNSLVEEQRNKAKTKILKARFTRQSAKLRERVNKVISPQKKFFADNIKKIKKQVSNLEEKYYDDSKPAQSKKQVVKDLLKEASGLIKNSKLTEAEKKIIKAIAKDKKNILAYELLGELYFKDKKYDQAEEIYKYLLKLYAFGVTKERKIGIGSLKDNNEAELDFLSLLDVDGKVAVYYNNLALVYETDKKYQEALDCCLKASTIVPNNPKYLDKLIALSIKVDDRPLAQKIYNRLAKINPKNAKLGNLKKAIEKL